MTTEATAAALVFEMRTGAMPSRLREDQTATPSTNARLKQRVGPVNRPLSAAAFASLASLASVVMATPLAAAACSAEPVDIDGRVPAAGLYLMIDWEKARRGNQ